MTVSADMSNRNKIVIPDPAKKGGQNVHKTSGVLLQAKGLTIRMRAGASLLSDISLHIEPGELVALTGPSRSGKSTLLHSLAGLMKPTSGEILIDGVSLYANLKAFRSSIGFVPADFPLEQHLTVVEILQEAARLRLPRSASDYDRQQRVHTILETVKLTHAADSRAGLLSKVDRRKLSIAVELIGYPGLLLVDESADPLTNLEEVRISTLLQELSRQGITVIQVNEQSRCVGLSDNVILLAPGGFLTWFGPAEEALSFLRSYMPGESTPNPFGFEDALEALVDPKSGDGIAWGKRYKANPAYPKYVDDPLNNRYPDLLLQTHPLIRLRSSVKEKLPPIIVPRANSIQTLILLIRRNSRVLWRGKTWLRMLAFPLMVALVDFVLSSRTMSDPQRGDPNRLPIVLGMLVFLDLLVSAVLLQFEISKDKAVYQRERSTNLRSFPYVLSKVWLVGILAIYQGLVWSLIHFVAIGMSGGLQSLVGYAITFTLVSFIGGSLGLTASALSRKPMMTIAWVLILTVPQLFLSGPIIPLAHLEFPFSFLSQVNPARYAFETLLTTSGYGLDVAKDPCWSIPAGQRNVLTDTQKQGCPCMGDNIYSICKFPGVQSFYSFQIEQPRPALPTPDSMINNIPAQPLLKQGETLNEYVAEVNSYTSQLEIYLGSYNTYLSSLIQYPDTLANWQGVRSLVIGKAESVIAEAIDHYGQAFNVNLSSHWAILTTMCVGLVILLIGIQQVIGIKKYE